MSSQWVVKGVYNAAANFAYATTRGGGGLTQALTFHSLQVAPPAKPTYTYASPAGQPCGAGPSGGGGASSSSGGFGVESMEEQEGRPTPTRKSSMLRLLISGRPRGRRLAPQGAGVAGGEVMLPPGSSLSDPAYGLAAGDKVHAVDELKKKKDVGSA